MSYKDDYNKAIFLNVYGNGKPLQDNSEYQKYFEFECGITNPRKYHKNLIKEGYLQTASPESSISSLKVNELKKICDAIGISKTGKKKELVDRIISSCSPDQINSFVEKQLYSLSDKGLQFLERNRDYVELHNHKNWSITLDEYIDFKNSLSFTAEFRDVAWGIFNKRILEYSKKYGLLRNNYLNMSQLSKESGNHNNELKYLLYTLFFDICGSELVEHLVYCDTRTDALEHYYCMAFHTRIPSEISELKAYYNETYVDEIYSSYKRLPLILCDKETFKLLIADIFDKQNDIAKKYEELFKQNYNTYICTRFSSKDASTPMNVTPKSGGCLTSVVMICFILCLFLLV